MIHLLQTFGWNLQSLFKKYQYWQTSHSFNTLILLTSIPSETSVLSKYSIYNNQTFILKYFVLDLSLYEPFSKNIL